MERKLLAAGIVVIAIVAAAALCMTMESDEEDDGRIAVSYNANGGEGRMDASRCDPGSSVLIKGCTYTDDKDLKRFVSWNTAADGLGTTYAAGDRISPESDIVLYAQWEHYTVGDFGVGSKVYYELSGGYTYRGYVCGISGDIVDTITSVGTKTHSYERSYTQIVTVGGQSSKDSRTITGSEDRSIEYKGERSTLQTEWGLKDVIVTVDESLDDAGHTVTMTQYRDATTHIRYKSVMSAPEYTAGGQTLKNYTFVMTLSGYDASYAGSA